MFSVDCYLSKHYPSYEAYFIEGSLALLSPLLIVLSFLLVWVVMRSCKCSPSLKPFILSTLLSSMFMLHPSLMDYGLSLFNCYEVNGVSLLKDRMDIECWSD